MRVNARPDPEFRPLGGKAYGSIPHLPGSRTGPADRHLSPTHARICTGRPRDAHDHVVVLEKLDGSCVAAARLGDAIVALGREGRLAAHSPNEARRLWAAWVAQHSERFLATLQPGERLVGEWLALAHGTRYALRHEPFVAFDLLSGNERRPWREVQARVNAGGFVTPGLIHEGGPLSIDAVMKRLQGGGFHGWSKPWRERPLPGSSPVGRRRGKGRFRPKDLFDVYLLAKHSPLDPALLPRALRLAFDSRGDSLELTSRLVSGEFGRSPWSLEKWARFRQSLPEGRPEQLAEVVASVAAVLGPVVAAARELPPAARPPPVRPPAQ